MINITIGIDGDIIHTFSKPPTDKEFRNMLDLWRSCVADVSGYTVSNESNVSMHSLAPDEWRATMIKNHRAECVETATRLAAYCGIEIKTDKKAPAKKETSKK